MKRILSLLSVIILATMNVDLFSAINAVNDKYHLVKVSRADEFILRFTHCLKEDRYLNFKADLPEYIRELDDALESFLSLIHI